ncbi:MAG: hypothetical protein QOF62_3133 [Pyrinomonadaceae bacterium]|nr:hypothetical protein [Pyrinomonadaceae bacterium]
MELPATLITAARSGDMVPLIGSGLSQASGMASWNEIVETLKKILLGQNVLADFEIDIFETPDVFRSETGVRALMSVLEEAVVRGFAPNSLHRLLADIPFHTILTTNWDSLIEDSLREARTINVIFDDDTARTWRESQGTQIIKVHGTVQHPNSVVIGSRDYSRLYQSPSVLMSLVRTLIATRPVLSLGFGMRDPFIKSLFHPVSGYGGRQHFIVAADQKMDSMRRRYWEDLGLSIIEVKSTPSDPYGLEQFLRELWKQTYTEARSRIDRTSLLIRETAKLLLYLGADKTVRARASMGPLAVPEKNDTDVFGGEDIFAIEKQLLDTVLEFVDKKHGKLKLICCPLDLDHAMRKGYSKAAYHGRLHAFVKWVVHLGESVELVTTARATDINDWIVADKSLIESRKSITREGRLYEYARLDVNPNAVSAAVRRFDEEFSTLAELAGGVSKSRERFLELAQAELGKHC